MDTEPTRSLEVRVTHLEELSERIDNRLTCIETQLKDGFAEVRADSQAFRAELLTNEQIFRTELDGISGVIEQTFEQLDRKITSRTNVMLLLYGFALVLQVLLSFGIIGR